MLDIPTECPDLDKTLIGTSFARYTGLDGESQVSTASLRELQYLLFQANHLELGAHKLRHDALAGILQEAYQPQPEIKKTLWQIFMEWLNDQFETDVDTTYLKGILEWLSKHLPVKTLAEYLTYGAILILVLLVLGLVGYQLYEARVLPRFEMPSWMKRFQRRVPDAASVVEANLHEIRILPVADQPGAILAWCVRQLQQMGLLSDVRDRTNYELLQSIKRSATASVALSFQTIIEAAERAVYGGARPGDGEVALLYERAECFSVDPVSHRE